MRKKERKERKMGEKGREREREAGRLFLSHKSQTDLLEGPYFEESKKRERERGGVGEECL